MDCFLTDATDPAGSAVPAMSATPKAEKRRGVRMTSSPTRPMWASMSWGLQATGFVTRKRVAPLLTTRASMPQDVLVMHRIPRKLVVIGLAAAAALLLGGLPRAAHAAKLCSQCNSCDPCGTPCSTTPDGEPMSACAPPLCLPVGGLCSDICGGATPAGTPCSEQISETQCVASLCPEAPPPVTCATSDTGEVIHGAAGAIHYFHTDALGSTRMATDGDWGAANARYDYLPFGEEIPAGVNDRGNAPGSGYNLLSFDSRHKFTGKERDGESELDYFGARYYSAAMGRFTSVDPQMNTSAAILNPQRWNLYAYALNNPFVYVDPDGRSPATVVGSLGEKLAEYYLQKAGYTIVLSGARKAVTTAGFDIIAKKGTEVLLVDNKAFLTRGTAYSANALTVNLGKNLQRAVAEMEKRLESRALSAAERVAVEEAIEAVETGAFKRIVTGAGGMVARVGPKLAAAGVSFRALGSLGGALLITALTEAVFCDHVNGDPASDVPMTKEEMDLYMRWRMGEPVFDEPASGSPSQFDQAEREYEARYGLQRH